MGNFPEMVGGGFFDIRFPLRGNVDWNLRLRTLGKLRPGRLENKCTDSK